MSYDYQKACDDAAKAQGITKLVAELSALGVGAEIHQTGGFTMAAYVPLEGGYGVYANEEGATLYRDAGDQPEDECEHVATSAYRVAESVAAFVKRWREGLDAMRAARVRVDDLSVSLPDICPHEQGVAGFVYDGSWWIYTLPDGRYSVIVCNGELSGSLDECEAYLWNEWVRSQS